MLGIEDQFEGRIIASRFVALLGRITAVIRHSNLVSNPSGLTYCRYVDENFPAKPEVEMYKKAMRDANVTVHNKCYFVDDSAANVEAATKLGWISVHVADDPKQSTAGDFQIHAVTELPLVLPDLWQRKQ